MKQVFADTSFFIALLQPEDQFHAAAQAVAISYRKPLLTRSAVILELGAHYSKAHVRDSFFQVLGALERGNAEIVHVDAPLQARSIELFRRRPDKNWSLADCISFLVMEDLGIRDAATSDEHLEQAGFVALLRTPSVRY